MREKQNTFVEQSKLIIAKPFMEIHPHILTGISLYFSFMFFVTLILHAFIPALLAFILTAFDMIDGTVSRVQKKESRFGFFLDSTCDRISDFLLISAFGFAGYARWEIIVPLLGVSFLISFIKSRIELALYGKISLHAGIIERPQRWIILLISLISIRLMPCDQYNGFTPIEYIFLALLLLSVITIFQRSIKGYHLLKE
jgi:CDP-diacylglycerol---glycerol-3-phosphate 3-phosphatidyltransferase